MIDEVENECTRRPAKGLDVSNESREVRCSCGREGGIASHTDDAGVVILTEYV